MSPTPILLIAGSLFVASDVVRLPVQKPGQPAAQPQVPAQPQVAKPIRVLPPVRDPFQLRVQKNSRFPKEARPAASNPASNNGLEITIQPEKKEFAGNGPLAFEVVLTNRSKKGFMLHSSSFGGGASPKLVISNQTNANQWTIAGKWQFGPSPTPLEPGKSLTLTFVVESRFIGPVPFPRPIPRPFLGRPDMLKGKAAAQIRIGKPGRPIRPPVIVRPNLPCGEGKCRARLFLEFTQTPLKRRYKYPHWIGKIATGTVDFKVGKPQPVVGPGGPATKEQAIRVSHPVAERALQGNYKPVANIRPPRVGPWIESPEKTATVKKTANGGWTVSWTSFPKNGHGYNITIDVSRNGGAVVREVFTNYSKR